jgi:excisionase family DNA binding protein
MTPDVIDPPRGGPGPPILLTREEAAALLQVSTRTLDRLIQRGAFATCRIGRAVRVPLPALTAYIEQNYE